MNNEGTISTSGGIGLFGIGFILSTIFMILKLCSAINWSWLLIFLPLIIAVGIDILLILILLIAIIVMGVN